MKGLEITNSLSDFKHKTSNSRCVHSCPGESPFVLLKAQVGAKELLATPLGRQRDPDQERGRCVPRAHAGVAAMSDLEGLLASWVPKIQGVRQPHAAHSQASTSCGKQGLPQKGWRWEG